MSCFRTNHTATTVSAHSAVVETTCRKSRLRLSFFQKLRRWRERELLTRRSGAGGGDGTGATLDMLPHITVFARNGKC